MVLIYLGKRKVHEVGGSLFDSPAARLGPDGELKEGERVTVRMTSGGKLVIDPLAVPEAGS